jgi:hypothetical protein
MSRRRRGRKPVVVAPKANLPAVTADPEHPPTEPVYTRRLPGRPSLLTPELEGRFVGMLLKGTYRTVAARACGLSPITVERWIKRGRGKDPTRPPFPEYVRFVRLVEQAEAMVESDVTGNIVHRSKYDHNAGLAWLRTRYPERWPRFPGGEEEEYPEGHLPPPNRNPPMETPPAIAQQTNILVLNSEEWPELAHRLIAQQRSVQETAAAEAAANEPPLEEETDVGVPRHSRLSPLRAES